MPTDPSLLVKEERVAKGHRAGSPGAPISRSPFCYGSVSDVGTTCGSELMVVCPGDI